MNGFLVTRDKSSVRKFQLALPFKSLNVICVVTAFVRARACQPRARHSFLQPVISYPYNLLNIFNTLLSIQYFTRWWRTHLSLELKSQQHVQSLLHVWRAPLYVCRWLILCIYEYLPSWNSSVNAYTLKGLGALNAFLLQTLEYSIRFKLILTLP